MTKVRLVLLVTLLSCAGCGQTGPLFLPAENGPVGSDSGAPPADSAPERNEDEEDGR